MEAQYYQYYSSKFIFVYGDQDLIIISISVLQIRDGYNKPFVIQK